MMKKALAALAVLTMTATGAHAATTVTYTQSAIGTAPVGGTTITFDEALPSGFSRVGGMVQSTDNSFGRNPTGSTNYLTTNLLSGAGSASIFSKVGFNNISFDWGSVDTYNTFGLLDAMGNAFYTLAGSQIQPHDQVNGTRISLTSAGQAIYGLRLYSGQPAFEVDNVNFSGAVPEPATWAMMLLGFGAIGFAARRRSAAAGRAVAA